MRLGVHVLLKPYLPDSARESAELGCTSIQIFSKSPRTWYTSPLEGRGLAEFRAERKKLGLWPLAVHASYLINLAAVDPTLRERSILALADELVRADSLGAEYLVVHIGSSQEQAREPLAGRVADSIRRAFDESGTVRTRLLLENMAGEGGDVGSELRRSGLSWTRWGRRIEWASAWTPATPSRPATTYRTPKESTWCGGAPKRSSARM
jgi:deoxyribonuclease-4